MASPQKENGYTAIANETMEALASIRIPGEARQILDVILRKTYGWNKKEDEISLSQFKETTSLLPPNIIRARSKLLKMNIISVIQKDNTDITTYRFQKDYTKWKPLSKKITLSKRIISVIQKDNLPLSKRIHTKDTITKPITKTKCSKRHSELAALLESEIKERIPRHKFVGKQYLKNWANEFRIMEEKKEATIDEIKELIFWIYKNSFWYKNILSAAKLREKLGRLFVDMKDDKKKRGIQTQEEFNKMQRKALEGK